MRRQEYFAVGILVVLVVAAWYFQSAKESERNEARAVEQVQKASTK